KIVVVGDGGCGKTSLLIVYTKGEYPGEYVPTIFETYNKVIEINQRQVELTLWDTAGQEEYDRLRPLSYPETDVFLVCFSIDNRETLEDAFEKWIPECKHFCPFSRIYLIGLKSDLR
ncbi:hypothetical protein CANCADRAFT_18075, partial [Tortispora caseinolytica NRRL Y-17796]